MILWSTAPMEKAIINGTRVTDSLDEVGHIARNILDNDLDTYWKQLTFNDRSLYIDLREQKDVEGAALWLHDYNNDYYYPHRIVEVYSSTDDSSYSKVDDFNTEFQNRGEGEALLILDFLATHSARYWRLFFDHFGSIPVQIAEISGWWLLNKHDIPNAEYTRSKEHEFSNVPFLSDSKIIQSRNANKVPVKNASYTISLPTDTSPTNGERAEIIDAFEECKGSTCPVIVDVDGDPANYFIGNFDEKGIDLVEKEYLYYQTIFKINGMAYKSVPRTYKYLSNCTNTVGNWQFIEDYSRGTIDDSGNNNDWTLTDTGSPDYIPRRTLEFFSGVASSGKTTVDVGSYDSTSYDIADADSSDFQFGTDAFTIELIGIIPYDMNRYGSCLLYTDAACYTQGFRLIMGSTNAIGCHVGDNSTKELCNANTAWAVNEWNYVAVVVDHAGAGTTSFYYNGAPDGVTSYTPLGSISTSHGLTWAPTNSNRFYVDQVVMHRQILTADTIAIRAEGFLRHGLLGV